MGNNPLDGASGTVKCIAVNPSGNDTCFRPSYSNHANLDDIL